MTHLETTKWGSTLLFRFVGYGLLGLALFDVVNILIPPNFMNPVWEFQTLGALVEHVPVPLIGLVMVFYGEANGRTKAEKFSLKYLSWASLLIGILFLLLIPLGMTDSWRISHRTSLEFDAQVNQQIAQLKPLKQQLNQGTAKDLNKLLTYVKRQDPSVKINNSQELKKQLSSEIATAENKIKTEAEAAQKTNQLTLLKNSVKWNLGALIAGVLFIYVWRTTRWTGFVTILDNDN